MKKKLTFAFVILFAFLCSACAIPTEEKAVIKNFSVWYVYTLEEACTEADMILVGTVDSIRKICREAMIQNPDRPSHYMAYTDMNIRVEKICKGGEQEKIKCTQTGGETRDAVYIFDELPLIKKGDRALFFLTEREEGIVVNYLFPLDEEGKLIMLEEYLPDYAEALDEDGKIDLEIYLSYISGCLSSQPAG